MKSCCRTIAFLAVCWPACAAAPAAAAGLPAEASAQARAAPSAPTPYRVVDTGQTHFFSDTGPLPRPPRPAEPFFGQDAFYRGPQPNYRDNADGTVTDLATGLMWQKTPELDRKLTYPEAVAQPARCRLAGHADWRLPTVKELYSLINFNGNCRAQPPVPYLDTRFFDFRFGDESKGERLIDSQFWSGTEYVGQSRPGSGRVFGVNFADGRIKAYPRDVGRTGQTAVHFVRLVRGNPDYGKNRFVDNRDATISDLATGLMWTQADSGKAMNWEQALAYCENLQLAGHGDWRLPNAKELQSIVDYSRAPDAVDPSRRGPAIDPLFKTTDGEAWFWTGTTHLEGGRVLGDAAVYIAFGRATGFMPGPDGVGRWMNVHGAGAQRSDPKSGDPKSPMWAGGRGPQGDEVRIFNFARAVRNIEPGTAQVVQPAAAYGISDCGFRVSE